MTILGGLGYYAAGLGEASTTKNMSELFFLAYKGLRDLVDFKDLNDLLCDLLLLLLSRDFIELAVALFFLL